MGNADTRKRLTEEYQILHAKMQEIQNNFPKEEGCCISGCYEDATWVRATQFSGVHSFCEAHAKLESDFGKSDPSYFYWSTVQEHTRIEAEIAEKMKAYTPDALRKLEQKE